MQNDSPKEFSVKGNDGCISVRLVEVWGFPDQTSHFGGYDTKCQVEIRSQNYSVIGTLYTTTGEMFEFLENLKPCQLSLTGAVKYNSYEDNLSLEIQYLEMGQVIISGEFQERFDIDTKLAFEIQSDQSYVQQTVRDLEQIVSKYGNNYGVKRTAN